MEEFREFACDRDEAKAWRVARQELDEDIHVAVGSEVVAQHGPEQRQARNMVALAERRYSLSIDRQVWTHRVASGVDDNARPRFACVVRSEAHELASWPSSSRIDAGRRCVDPRPCNRRPARFLLRPGGGVRTVRLPWPACEACQGLGRTPSYAATARSSPGRTSLTWNEVRVSAYALRATAGQAPERASADNLRVGLVWTSAFPPPPWGLRGTGA